MKDRTKRGDKCPFCINKKKCEKCLSFITDSKYTDEFDVKKNTANPSKVHIKSNVKVWWIHKKGDHYHSWCSTVYSRTIAKKGCPYCSNQATCSECNSLTKFPRLLLEYSNKNVSLADTIMCSSTKKVWWKCIKNHEWVSEVRNRTKKGTNCPKCKSSKGEMKCLEVIKSINKIKNFQEQYIIPECRYKKHLKFYFYCKLENHKEFLIEYQGEQHYNPVSFGGTSNLEVIKIRDGIKAKFCKEHNIPLLIICYSDFNNINLIINNFVNAL